MIVSKTTTPRSDSSYELQELHLELTDEDWTNVFAFKKAYAKSAKKSLAYSSTTAIKKTFLGYMNAGFKLFLVRKNGLAFGSVILYKKNFDAEIIFMKYDLLYSHIEQELFRILLNYFLDSYSSAEYFVVTSTDYRNDYIEKVLELELSEVRELFELKTEQVSDRLLSKWIANDSLNSNKFDIILQDELSNAQVKDYYALIKELNNDVTYRSRLFDNSFLNAERLKNHHDLYKEKGITHLVMLIFEKKGNRLLGYTDITIEPGSPNIAIQNMTGVKKTHRGKGWGKLLKASMMKKLLEKFPEVSTVKTAIHIENMPSQELNKQLGFRKVGTYKEYIISRESIINYVN